VKRGYKKERPVPKKGQYWAHSMESEHLTIWEIIGFAESNHELLVIKLIADRYPSSDEEAMQIGDTRTYPINAFTDPDINFWNQVPKKDLPMVLLGML
jgi:hypothetical protein